MIELKNVSAGYPDRPILEDISLCIHPGEVLVLLGPNGSGKSTLLRTILGLIPKLGGEVLIDGEELTTLTPKQIAKRVAFLTQSRTAHNISARKMVLHARFPYLSYPRRYQQADHEIVAGSLRRADAYDLAKRSMTQLSGGQRQKVYLAMVMAQQTPTILMDEPTTYLDIAHQFQVMTLAKELAKEGKAVVLVLHDLPLAMENADRVAVVHQGRLAAVGTPDAVYKSGILENIFSVRVIRGELDGKMRYICEAKEG